MAPFERLARIDFTALLPTFHQPTPATWITLLAYTLTILLMTAVVLSGAAAAGADTGRSPLAAESSV